MNRCHFLRAFDHSDKLIPSNCWVDNYLWQTIIIIKIRGETVLYGYKFSIQYLFWVCKMFTDEKYTNGDKGEGIY